MKVWDEFVTYPCCINNLILQEVLQNNIPVSYSSGSGNFLISSTREDKIENGKLFIENLSMAKRLHFNWQ